MSVSAYVGTQAGMAVLDTAIEGGMARWSGSEFNPAASLVKNFGVNLLTGGLGNKLKQTSKVGAFVLRNGISTVADTVVDVGVYGNDVRSSLVMNAAGNFGGDLLFSGLAKGAGKLRSQLGCFNSFVPGTLVLLADGTTKPIDEIEIGDWVWASDPETGEAGARQVTDLIYGEGEKGLVDITVDGQVITATDNHPFWVSSRSAWIDAADLQAGDTLLSLT